MQMPVVVSERHVAHTHVRARTIGERLARAILAGFAASMVMLLFFLVAYNLARLLGVVLAGRPGFSILASWLQNLTHNRLIDAGLSDVYVAAAVYLAGGLLWAVAYALVEPRLSGPDWFRGVSFALVPALLSLTVVLPMLGGGVFGAALGAGPLPTIGNLLLHVAYGTVLGLVYGPLGDADASTLHAPEEGEDPTLASWNEGTTAVLTLAGLIVGALLGVAVSLAAGADAEVRLLGGSSMALVLWGALLGAGLGLFVGPFFGLSGHAAGGSER
jgi:hypothetical protein